MSEPKPHPSVEDARDVEIASDDIDEQHFDASYRSPQEKALVWKQDLRIVPLCAAIYLLCYLDRSNIGKHGTDSYLADPHPARYRKCKDSQPRHAQ
jgi:hypothetical protein